jgi:hypothetical protein
VSDQLYEVIVGNVGMVYKGRDVDEAVAVFRDYLLNGYGRCSGEPIALMRDGHIVDEKTIPEAVYE